MAWFRYIARHVRHRSGGHERGATLSEYALLASLVLVASIGAVTFLEDESGSYLAETGEDIGEPRELASELDPDLPDPPDWLSVPPPPSSGSTTSSTAVVSTTHDTSPTLTTTTTTAPTSYPIGSVQHQGFLSTQSRGYLCYDPRNPGVAGSTIKSSWCASHPQQEVKVTGDPAVVSLQFTDPASAAFCFAQSGSELILAPCDGGDWQLFDVTDHGSGWYSFRSRSDGRCIEGTWSSLVLANCTGPSGHQRFEL